MLTRTRTAVMGHTSAFSVAYFTQVQAAQCFSIPFPFFRVAD
jgi:hypothetical protein